MCKDNYRNAIKESCIGANEKNFKDKELNISIVVRSKFRDTFLKFKSKENSLGYARQRKYC